MEQQSFYGQIDLAILGDIVRKQPELVKIVTGKDGKTRKFIDVYFNPRQTPSNYGHTHYMKVGVKKVEARQDVNYYIGDFKPKEPQQQQERAATSADVDDVPF